eukprot:g11518.t1
MVDTSGLAALALVGFGGYFFFTKVTRGDPLGFLIWVYFVLQANLSFGWLALNRFIDHVFLTPSEKNKIVVIGDGIAAGFGDWVTTGQNAGLTRRLKDKLAADESLLLRWKVFNCGHFAAISDEWLPNYLLAPMYMPLINGFYPLFNNVFNQGRVGYDAKIVIIVLGSFDCRRSEAGAEVDYTLDRLRRIVDELLKMKKYIIISSLLDVRYEHETKAEKTFMGKLNFKNSGIYKLCKEHPGRVFEGANMTHVKYKVPRSVDNVHLNTEGYDMLGEETWQVLKNVFAKYKLDLAGEKAM